MQSLSERFIARIRRIPIAPSACWPPCRLRAALWARRFTRLPQAHPARSPAKPPHMRASRRSPCAAAPVGAADPSGADAATTPGDEPAYILSINAHRSRPPTCPSVDGMKEKNKRPFYGIRAVRCMRAAHRPGWHAPPSAADELELSPTQRRPGVELQSSSRASKRARASTVTFSSVMPQSGWLVTIAMR